MRISVVSLPLSASLIKCASTCICTISRAPRSTPQKIFEYHNSSCARPSSGSSTKSARGLSSKTSENCLLSLVQFVTVGVMLRKILKPTYICVRSFLVSRAARTAGRRGTRTFEIISAVSRKLAQRFIVLDLAR